METPSTRHTALPSDNIAFWILSIHFLNWMQTKRSLLLPVSPLYSTPSHPCYSISYRWLCPDPTQRNAPGHQLSAVISRGSIRGLLSKRFDIQMIVKHHLEQGPLACFNPIVFSSHCSGLGVTACKHAWIQTDNESSLALLLFCTKEGKTKALIQSPIKRSNPGGQAMQQLMTEPSMALAFDWWIWQVWIFLAGNQTRLQLF